MWFSYEPIRLHKWILISDHRAWGGNETANRLKLETIEIGVKLCTLMIQMAV